MRFAKTLIAGLVILSAGCDLSATSDAPRATTPAALSEADGHKMVRTEIVFPQLKGDGSAIDEYAWEKFVDDAITVWFPSGFTIEDARGRWRGPDGKIVAERSKVLVLLHDGSDATLRKIDELRSLYSQRFGQKSIVRSTGEVWVAF